MSDALEIVDYHADVTFDAAAAYEEGGGGVEFECYAGVLVFWEFEDVDVGFGGADECS